MVLTAPAAPVLPDHLAPGLRLIFCGSAAGHVSARRGAYYAGPGNLFWPMLAETGLTPRRFAPEEAAELLPLGIGLTDLAKEARGMDHEIPRAAYTPDRLRALIARYAPRHLAFNGKRAAQIALDRALGYGSVADHDFGPLTLWVLPSTSAAGRRWFDPGPWHEMAHAAQSD